MKRWFQIAGLAGVAILAVLVTLQFTGRSSHKITERAKQSAVAADADALSAKLIPSEDLPPEDTRSLFDHLIAQNESLPFPFEKLIAALQKLDPAAQPPLVVMIPHGRSLLKASADYEHPRVLLAL